MIEGAAFFRVEKWIHLGVIVMVELISTKFRMQNLSCQEICAVICTKSFIRRSTFADDHQTHLRCLRKILHTRRCKR